MNPSVEKLCLKWNDFEQNVTSAFGLLRQDSDFVDVTLVSEDGQQVDLHKVVLASSSPFFQQLLKRSKQSQHPWIFMRGCKFEDLSAVVDFLYYGEANVFQENLDCFLALAGELQLKGLSGNVQDEKAHKTESQPQRNKKKQKSNKKTKIGENQPVAANESFKDPNIQSLKKEGTTNVNDHVEIAEDLQGKDQEIRSVRDLVNQLEQVDHMDQMNLEEQVDQVKQINQVDQEIRSMMEKSKVNFDSAGRPATICKVCGKEGQQANIWNHIETKHVTSNVSYTCDFCGKSSGSRNGMFLHKSKCINRK